TSVVVPHKDDQTAIRVARYGRSADDFAGYLVSGCPASTGRDLPDMPQRTVARVKEDLEAPVRISRNGGIIHARTVQRRPARPARPGRRDLIRVPELSVAPQDENLQPPVRIDAHHRVAD